MSSLLTAHLCFAQSSNNPSTEAPRKSMKKIQGEIRDIIRQITASVTFLPVLSEPCAFDLLVYANTDVSSIYLGCYYCWYWCSWFLLVFVPHITVVSIVVTVVVYGPWLHPCCVCVGGLWLAYAEPVRCSCTSQELKCKYRCPSNDGVLGRCLRSCRCVGTIVFNMVIYSLKVIHVQSWRGVAEWRCARERGGFP